ncbi:MAG TPA: protein kinase [Pyrinomonadaceae bacterium]|nr:protein kinase [Pyrinomonadaceae bacterium]
MSTDIEPNVSEDEQAKAPPALDPLLSKLREIYERQDKGASFDAEAEEYRNLLPKLREQLAKSGYDLGVPLAIGSTASVWIVEHKELMQKRALKLPRPQLGKLKNIVRVVRAERERLAALNHQNIIKIYHSGEVDLEIQSESYSFPYFIMEYLEDIRDIDDYVIKNRQSLTGEKIIGYFRDLLSGLAFLHDQGIVHCDIKPGNLLKAPKSPALVADLGYAKHFDKQPRNGEDRLTQVIHTPEYAHPELKTELSETSDSNANIALVPHERLRPAFDLFAFGRSMRKILTKLRDAERNDPITDYGDRSIFTPYQWSCLGYISKRLLDGLVLDRAEDDLEADAIAGLPDKVMKELRYASADEALEDFEKLLHLYDLEGEIPELNPNLSSYIQIPHCRVPLTRRVQEVINHPTFMRLAQVTQLGFVSLVYPSATHTRFEHVLGTFAHCCEYVRALWYDQSNGLFQNIMSKKDIELGLLAALLHDIGQYPMAHDLTEVVSDFAHERFTVQALIREDPATGESLGKVISSEWDVGIEDLLKVMSAKKASDFRHRILGSIISGPLDCDKLDYLKRDSTHLGVMFGLSIDHERLLRNLTIAYQSREFNVTQEGREIRVRELETAEIGITEKALVVAQSLWKVRKDMFSQIYWQHTTRALKAMLGYVVRDVLLRLDTDAKKDQFWAHFEHFLFAPFAFTFVHPNTAESSPATTSTEIEYPEELRSDALDESQQYLPYSHLDPTDDALLLFLWNYSSADGRTMIQAIRSRKVYRRWAVLSGARRDQEEGYEKTMYTNIYGRFRTYRLDGDIGRIESDRKKWENELIDRIDTLLTENPRLIPQGKSRDAILSQLDNVTPLILVDIPLKSTSAALGSEFLLYLPEDYSGIHSRLPGAFPQFTPSLIDIEQTNFDREVGKIRVLAHPEWTDFLVRCLPERTVLEIISGIKQS